MIYGIILSVGIGASTLVSTHSSSLECQSALTMIIRNQIQSATCIPGESKEDLQNKVKDINNTISGSNIRSR